ncbi:MAG: carbohydrate ABC transporter permease [bacterium]
MRFLRKNRLEILMITPLFLYIIGFTLVPVMSNVKDSLIDQKYGRKYLALSARIKDIRFDIKNTADEKERKEYLFELEEAREELASLKKKESGFSLNNYITLFKNNTFIKSILNTLAITLTGLILQLVTAMGLALFLTQRFKGKGIFRTIVLTPLGIPTIVSATIMTYIFNTKGYLNEILYRIGIIGRVPIDWAQGGFLSVLMIAFADTWKVLPLLVLLFIAGLESIPDSVHEACQIDGASQVYKFFTITLPLLKPHITIALILRAIDAFRIFELPLILTGSATLPVISTFTYSEYSRQNYNLSAASATILTAIIMIFVFGYLFIAERERNG